ncbi:suppressor of fused domain protein [Spirillospora sp. NPDC048911]|uniref:suppressor of fused domain protein n=1 Tax=Spirillospora sp. NPDC048911 TaxID=3364527 RepID=UPI00371CCE0D
MATHSELVRLFGADEVITLDPADAERHGLRPADAEALCSAGLPVTADMFFTTKVDGDFDTFTLVEAGPLRLLVLGKAATDDRVRYCLDIESGLVLTLGLDDGVPRDAEPVNSTLDDFVEFLYRISLRTIELAGSPAEEARLYTEQLLATLRARDEKAFTRDGLWAVVFDAYLESGVPEGSRMAIVATLEALLPDRPRLRWSTEAPVGQGVQELSAHRADGHWLLVTHGFSDLDGILDLDTTTSGLGFELTMRVPCGENDEQPPGWALQALLNLGDYVFGDGYPFADGHRMRVAGSLGDSGRLTALAFVTDPLLGTIEAPNGRVDFITAVGVTADELAEAKENGNDSVVARLTETYGVPLTDVSR